MEAAREQAADALRRAARLSVESLFEATLLAEASGLSEEEIEAAIEQGTMDAAAGRAVLTKADYV